MNEFTPQRLADRAEIQDCLCRYARGVDRGDWAMVRTTYHPDAYDAHGDYKGDIDGLIEWLDRRFAGVDNSMHFLGNCLIEFFGANHAFVETYFASRRLRPPGAAERERLGAGDAMVREAWGRYADCFERREGVWRVAHRIVVLEQAYTAVALAGVRGNPDLTWGRRDADDPSHAQRARARQRAG
jgi:SnoaL-like domain